MKQPQSLPIALIVSSDSYRSAFFKKALKGSFSIIDAADSFAAAEWLKSVQAAVIIIDEKALSNSWALLSEHIRKLPGYAHTPILLISNKLKKDFTAEALKMGISDFLLEPLDPEETMQRIKSCLQTRPSVKKVSSMSKKIKKSPAMMQKKLHLPQRFVITQETMKKIAAFHKAHPSLCLLFIEIDHWKEIEMQKALIDQAEVFLQARCRKFDLLLTQGGGRFLMLLPNTSQQAASAIAEMIRKETQSISFSVEIILLDKNVGFDALLGKVGHALKKGKPL